MPDREKVINGLREMSFRATWKDIDGVRHKFQPIINDALALLKEQEAVHPICTGGYMHFETQFVCPKCATPIFDDARFCSGCGNPVLWEDR